MPSAHEYFSEQFEKWEKRGRGWQVFEQPVQPEPPFVPFTLRAMTDHPVVDDGCRPSFLGSLFRGVARKPTPAVEPEPEAEPEPTPLIRDSLVELQASLPDKLDISRETFEQFLLNLSLCREPLAFELLGTHQKLTAQFTAAAADAPLLRRQLAAFFPEAMFVPIESNLESAWNATTGDEMLAVEFGLEREFMLPLASGKLDPFIGIIGALAELQSGELGLFQVLFQPVQNPWAENITDSVTHRDGKPLFVNAPELTGAAENKIAKPLFAAVVRILVCAEDFDRVLQLASDLAGSLRVFAHPRGNALIPLHNEAYPFEDHIDDVLRRQTRRAGMLLNSDELIGFVHLPSSAVRSPAFQRQTTKTKAAPNIARHGSGLLLGENEHNGLTVSVSLTPEQRVHHCHIIGASGTGKSTLLFNLIRQSIDNNEGIAVLDPHGDLIDKILGVIPSSRIDDVILVDPADEDYAIGFNILSAHTNVEKNLLASDLVAVFQRLSTSWGDQMNSVLQNAILAFLESDRGGTLSDLRRFLVNPAYRNEFLKTVKDSGVVEYWQESFPHLGGNKSIGSILTRLDTFLAQKPIRHMVSQPQNKLDFARIMDTGKILLAKLPEGLLGRENSYLLGTLLVSKFQQIAMSRQAQRIEARRMFNIVIDEFANFITPSMAEILSGARKYRIGLTLAHHELHQLQRSPEVASAVMTHPYTRIVFRVGDDDARKLAEGFSSFEAQDLRNLETGQAICRVERSDFDFNLTVPLPDKTDETEAATRRQEVITVSRNRYATPRSDVEAMLAKSRTPPSREAPANSPLTKPVESKQSSPQVAVVAESPPASPPAKPEPKPPAPLPALKLTEAIFHPTPPKAEIAPTSPPAIEPKSPEFLPPIVVPELKPAAVLEKKTPSPPADLGKGGEQHKAMQRRIKEAAEALGFRSVIEQQIAGGQESVDLLLERGDQKIACEISVTTTIDHEVGNIRKCLKAGFPLVAIICVSEDRLQKIAAAVTGSLGMDAAAHIKYFQPDQFIAHLKTLPVPVHKDSITTSRGYKVKRSAPALTEAERRQREDIANKMMAEAMRPRH